MALLREVYEADRYPVVRAADPFRWLSARDHRAAWVDEDTDRVPGHLSLQRTDSSRARPEWGDALRVPADQLAVVSRFFAAPDARGRGVGSALMGRAEAHAAGQDLTDLTPLAVQIGHLRRPRRAQLPRLLHCDRS